MKRARRLLACALLATTLPGAAQQQLTRWSVDGGGGRSSSAQYVLTGSVGQPDAVPLLASGPYRLGGGFWSGVEPGIFRDGFEER